MKIGVTSQNFKTITGHAGKTRRFLVIGQDAAGKAVELERIDLPKHLSIHEYHGSDHPIFKVDVLLTGSSGRGFVQRMQDNGVQVIATSETDPLKAAAMVFAGESLPAPDPHEHDNHHGHHHAGQTVDIPGVR